MRLQVVLLTVASIAALASLQPVHSTFVFASYTNWARQCLGGPSDGVCGPSAAQFLDFTYSALTGAPVTVSTEQLTSACQQCAPALDAALATAVPSSDPAACPFLPEKDSLSLASTALRRFVCWGTPSAATTSPGGDGGSNSTGTGAGACVTMMADALAAADLLERVRSFDPTLRFTGSVLQRLCPQLAPPAAGGPGGSCCSRSWAYLMSGLASQACLPDLAREYLALPGRCEVLLGLPLPGFCEAGWPSALMPLLAAPPSGRCSGANQPISWLQGSACSTDQLRMARCPRSTCDLWCGVVGTAAAADQPAPPSPPSGLNTDSGGGTGGSSGGGGSSDSGMTVATVVIICVFSVLILALLVALAMWAFAVRREKRAAEREGFAFDQEFNDAPTVPASPAAPPGKLVEPATPGATASGAAPPPGSAGGAGGFAAAITAAAAGVGAAGASTPRYIPGGGGGGGGGGAAGDDGAAGPSTTSGAGAAGGGSNVARTLVFDGAAAGPSRAAAAGGGGSAAAGGAAAATVAAAAGGAAAGIMASSKYGSAQSLLRAPPSAAGASTHGTSTGVFMTPATSEKSLAQLDRLRSHRVSNPGSEMGTQYDSMPLPDNMSSVEGSVSNLPPGAYIGSHAVLSRDSAGSYVTARSGAVSGTSLLSGPGAGGSGLASGTGSVLLGPGPGTSPPLPRSQLASGTASPLPAGLGSPAPGVAAAAAAVGPSAVGAAGVGAGGSSAGEAGAAAGSAGAPASAATPVPLHTRRASDIPVLETVKEH
ncbi:hypothetical protein CHLRE_14g618550v5 [Chlamydomonas reinhardtii]|uniref:SPARK domain-containing protein n=1 Tax=Chlamydomonas reinhardtii TaxID=3055 RepID=A0A2K3CXS2_CHLRE|nr:uncharacterized protein CHLRE_14g618550v5 [Chlamydomonas reinhardtii]PNW73088.1 hypothetical protein CHLRE_14g618550v5 [Chlamydomonas reinhardtii]